MLLFETKYSGIEESVVLVGGHPEPLRKSAIRSLLNQGDLSWDINASACWSFNNDSKKNGYKLTITIEIAGDDSVYEVFPTTKYPFTQQRVFKTFEALERFCIDLGFDRINVDFG